MSCWQHGWESGPKGLDLRWAVRKLGRRLAVGKLGGDCCCDRVVVAEGILSGFRNGANLADDLPIAADVVEAAAAHSGVVRVVGWRLVLLWWHVLSLLG